MTIMVSKSMMPFDRLRVRLENRLRDHMRNIIMTTKNTNTMDMNITTMNTSMNIIMSTSTAMMTDAVAGIHMVIVTNTVKKKVNFR